MGYWILDLENFWKVYFNQLNSYYENRKYFKDGRMFASDFEHYCRYRDGSKSVLKEIICNSAPILGLK